MLQSLSRFLFKIEILMYCQQTSRQKLLYQALKNKISIDDLLQSSMGTTQQAQNTTSSLMNLVMQFRKVRFVNTGHTDTVVWWSLQQKWLDTYIPLHSSATLNKLQTVFTCDCLLQLIGHSWSSSHFTQYKLICAGKSESFGKKAGWAIENTVILPRFHMCLA